MTLASLLEETRHHAIEGSFVWSDDSEDDSFEEDNDDFIWSDNSVNDDDDSSMPPCPSGKSFEWEDFSASSSSSTSSEAMPQPEIIESPSSSARLWSNVVLWLTTTSISTEYYDAVDGGINPQDDLSPPASEPAAAPPKHHRKKRLANYFSCLKGGEQPLTDKKYLRGTKNDRKYQQNRRTMTSNTPACRPRCGRGYAVSTPQMSCMGKKHHEQNEEEESFSPLLEGGSW